MPGYDGTYASDPALKKAIEKLTEPSKTPAQEAADELFERLAKIGMSLSAYEHLAASTLNPAIQPSEEVAWFAASMACSEAGEVMEHLRKHRYQGHELDTEKVLYELGDLLWALTNTARALGSSLEQVARMNNAKLAKRYPNGFTVQDSIARVDGL